VLPVSSVDGILTGAPIPVQVNRLELPALALVAGQLGQDREIAGQPLETEQCPT
jgi:hypothetical protein